MSREFRFLATEFVACSKPQAEIIIVKRPIQGRNNVTRMCVEPSAVATGGGRGGRAP